MKTLAQSQAMTTEVAGDGCGRVHWIALSGNLTQFKPIGRWLGYFSPSVCL